MKHVALWWTTGQKHGGSTSRHHLQTTFKLGDTTPSNYIHFHNTAYAELILVTKGSVHIFKLNLVRCKK